MKPCPVCKSPLEPGFVELRSGWFDFLAYGWSHLILTFSDGEDYEYDVLEPTQRNEALGCSRCGAVVITNRTWSP